MSSPDLGVFSDPARPPRRPPPWRLPFSSAHRALAILWGFVESDLLTFAVPNTAFGVLGALAGSRLLDGRAPVLAEVLGRGPAVLFFNFYSLLLFDLANQREPASVEEDRVNKPWRPIPSGRVTCEQARDAMLVAAPLCLWFNHALGVWHEGLLVQVLSYYYNELNGGGGLLRDVIIAVSYGLANHTSLRLAGGSDATINAQGRVWTGIISAIILTTMHIQDLKDQEGDSRRGRRTLPLVLGDGLCRVVLAVLIPLFTIVTVRFWGLGLVCCLGYSLLAAVIVVRVVSKRDRREDSRTWRLWCLWHATLYTLPMLSSA